MTPKDWHLVLYLVGGGAMAVATDHLLTYAWVVLGCALFISGIEILAQIADDISDLAQRRRRRKRQAEWNAKHEAALAREAEWNTAWERINR